MTPEEIEEHERQGVILGTPCSDDDINDYTDSSDEDNPCWRVFP